MTEEHELLNGKTELDNSVCSNFDHVIDHEVVERLRRGDCYANYPGWDFNADITYDGEHFVAIVRQFGSVRSIESAKTFEELKAAICDKYGNE